MTYKNNHNNNNNDIMDLLENSNNNSIWNPSSPPSFHETMLNFDHQEGRQGRRGRIKRDYNDIEGDETGEDELELSPYQPEKKRRLSRQQVEYLEKSFEVENKLEPERKLELAKELGLQPRQVAIWFQNRRARYKTKLLEKEYGSLKASYDQLKLDFEALSKEKDQLQLEVKVLTKKLNQRDDLKDINPTNQLHSKIVITPKMEIENMDKTGLIIVPSSTTNQLVEEASSTKSDIVDSESPHWMEDLTGKRFDFSPEEEEDLMMNKRVLLPSTPSLNFLKVEDSVCYDLNASSCNFSLVDDHDQPFWSMLY